MMMVEKKTFAAWCERFEIEESKAASIAEAAAVNLADELTEVQFKRIAPQTVEDFLKYASRLRKDDRIPFCAKFTLDLNDPITQAEFAEKLAQYVQAQESAKPKSKPKPSAKPAKPESKPDLPAEPAKPTRLRVTDCTVIYNRTEYPHGSTLPSDFPDDERARLLKRGAVVEEG